MWEREIFIAAREIEPLHGITNKSLFDSLKESMKQRGWDGDPVLVVGGSRLKGINGSHRVAAASELDLVIPAISVGPKKDLKLCKSKNDQDVLDSLRKHKLHKALRIYERNMPAR